jgi:hypothetical protein
LEKEIQKNVQKNVDDVLSVRSRYSHIPASWMPMPILPEEIATLVTAVLSGIIERGFDKTIGGKIQCAIITSKGVAFPQISYSPDPTNEGPGWTRATAEAGELKRFTTVSGMLGFYHLDE